MFGAGPDSPTPLSEIKSERERMETNDNDLINGSERRALPIDNRGAYKCWAANLRISTLLPAWRWSAAFCNQYFAHRRLRMTPSPSK